MEEVGHKKIIFFTLVSISSIEDRNLYSDLMRHFVKMGHHVTILSPIERREAKSSKIIEGKNYKLIRFKSLNIQKTNIIEKLIATVSIDYLLKYTIKNN